MLQNPHRYERRGEATCLCRQADCALCFPGPPISGAPKRRTRARSEVGTRSPGRKAPQAGDDDSAIIDLHLALQRLTFEWVPAGDRRALQQSVQARPKFSGRVSVRCGAKLSEIRREIGRQRPDIPPGFRFATSSRDPPVRRELESHRNSPRARDYWPPTLCVLQVCDGTGFGGGGLFASHPCPRPRGAPVFAPPCSSRVREPPLPAPPCSSRVTWKTRGWRRASPRRASSNRSLPLWKTHARPMIRRWRPKGPRESRSPHRSRSFEVTWSVVTSTCSSTQWEGLCLLASRTIRGEYGLVSRPHPPLMGRMCCSQRK